MIALLLACTTECPDADCRQDEILSLWESDQDAATARIAALPDLIEKVAVVTVLTERWPGQTTALCDQLEGDARTRCRRLNHRPHLRQPPPPPAPSTARPAPGPPGPNILPGVPDPMADVGGIPAVPCGDAIEPRSCRVELALTTAKRGSVRSAVGLCRGLEGEARWREECTFQAAEKLLDEVGVSRLEDASVLCLASGAFAANCLSHLTRELSREAPPASAPGRGPWNPILRAAEALDGYWTPQDPVFAVLSIDRLWADALSRSYSRDDTVVGNPLDLLPEQARPHIIAAAAMRLMETTADPGGGLADWQARLDAALLVRSPRLLPTGTTPSRLAMIPLWPADGPGEGSIPAVFGPGNTRRPTSVDAATDRTLALLEVAARLDPPRRDLLEEAQQSRDGVVRWSAERLLALTAER